MRFVPAGVSGHQDTLNFDNSLAGALSQGRAPLEQSPAVIRFYNPVDACPYRPKDPSTRTVLCYLYSAGETIYIGGPIKSYLYICCNPVSTYFNSEAS